MHTGGNKSFSNILISRIDGAYKSYIHALSFIGSKLPSAGHHDKHHVGATPIVSNDEENHDALATELGNRYRGMGVAVGCCGVLSVLCALLPVGFSLDKTLKEVAVILELTFIVLMVLIVIQGIRSQTHGRWLYHRRAAEKQRYAALQSEIEHPDAGQRLKEMLQRILAGQIGYNDQKAKQYESIERFGNVFSWAGVVLALVAAVAHLLGSHASQLIFLSVFMPALVGATHGINGFLRLQDLAEDHAKMAERLRQLELELTDEALPSKIRILADSALRLLSNRDDEWERMTQRLDLKVG